MCKLCYSREKTWNGDDRNCAFDSCGNFTNDNWNCATMSDLRSLSEVKQVVNFNNRDDNSAGSIGVVIIPDNLDFRGYLIMTWYKSRGKCSTALIINDESYEELTEYKALLILNHYKNIK